MIDTQAIRNQILLLALHGKLVPQCQEEISAFELVSKLSEGLNEQVYHSDIEESEIPYAIPKSWIWCRLSDIGSTNIGLTYHPEDTSKNGTIVARSSNIINGKMDYSDLVRVTCQIRDNQYLNNNDILICARNGSKALVGKCAIYHGESKTVAFGAFMAVFRTPLFRYVYYYFNTPVFKRYFISDDSKQINQVTQSILKQSLIPLPPLAEQKRIVKKIDQTFSILDTIDELQSRYSDNLSVLKSKLIDAAIQGKLTEQLPEDGTAEELYQQIQIEKQKLIKEGKIKKGKLLPEITSEEVPFEIPINWKWIRLAEICSIINGDRGKNYPAKSTLKSEGIPFISALNLDGVSVTQDENLLCLNDQQYELLNGGKLQKDDIVICIRGSLGKHGRYPFEKGAIASSLVISRLFYSKKILGDYEMAWLDSSLFPAEIKRYNSGVAQPNLAANSLEKFLIPLPPLAEQQRIVARLDEILKLFEV